MNALRKASLLLLLLLAGIPPADAANRIAVVDLCHRRELEPLLAAELAKLPEVEVIKPEELARLRKEQLAELAGEGRLAELGKLLRADGLLVLESLMLPGERNGKNDTARLVSVHHGACVAFVPITPAEREFPLAEWVAGWVRKIGPAVPSLSIAAADARPISVLNLRAAIMSPELIPLESALTRLVERRLAALPNGVLLPRRLVGDEDFERRLNAADLSKLEAAVVIDGALEKPEGDAGAVEFQLSLRRPQGPVLGTAKVPGRVGEAAALAESVAQAVARLLEKPLPAEGKNADPAPLLDEAVWAWRSNLHDVAEEALRAARALGDQTPDGAALEAWLCVARTLSRGDSAAGVYLKQETLAPEEQQAYFQQALTALAEFRAGGGQLRKIRLSSAYAFRDPELRHSIISPASAFLRKNDSLPEPRDVTALRTAVHDAAGMQATGAAMPYSFAASGGCAADWARDSAELIAFYEKLLSSNHQWMSSLLKNLSGDVEHGLGPRFCHEEKAIAAWNAMWERLQQNPKTRLRALLVLANAPPSPAQAGRYRVFLAELAKEAAALYASKQMELFLNADSEGRSFHQDFMAERTACFEQLCHTLPGFVSMYSLINRLKVPPGEEQKAWEAFCEYRERCLKVADEKMRPQYETTFATWQGTLLANNPTIKVAEGTSGLLVHRFWSPYAKLDPEVKKHISGEMVIEGGSVWSIPFFPREQVYEVSLKDLSYTTRRLPNAGPGATLAVTADSLWLEYGVYPGDGRPAEFFLLRRDRQTSADRTYPLPRGGNSNLYVVNGRVFLDFGYGQDGGLGELNPTTGEFKMLVSIGRKPAQSPFDGAADWRSGGVIAGPGGEPCLVVQQNAGGVYQIGGAWTKVAALQWPSTFRSAASTLLVSLIGDGLLVDPARPQAEWCMAGPKSPPEVRAQARWDAPAGLQTGGMHATRAVRAGEIFALTRNGQGVHRLHWWRASGPREGVDIDLRFDLPEQQRAVLAPRRADFVGFTPYESLLNPNLARIPLRLQAAPEGVLLSWQEHGFWFIPNADLEAYVTKAQPK